MGNVIEVFDLVVSLPGDGGPWLALCCDRCIEPENSEFARLCLKEFGCGETRLTADELARRRAAAARAIRSSQTFQYAAKVRD
jgi:hypothetical protein